MIGALNKNSSQQFLAGGGQKMVRTALRIGVPVSLGSVGWYSLEGMLREPISRRLAGGTTLPVEHGGDLDR